MTAGITVKFNSALEERKGQYTMRMNYYLRNKWRDMLKRQRALTAACVIGLGSFGMSSAQSSNAHGTINIILSNGSDVVMVADKRLTWTFKGAVGSKSNTKFSDDAQKVYQLDDHTLCIMAGFYEQNGIREDNSLDVLIPTMIQTQIERIKAGAYKTGFAPKVDLITASVAHQLTAFAQSMSVKDDSFRKEQPQLTLELTIVGYDTNGSLQIADRTFASKYRSDSGASFALIDRPRGPVTPSCENTAFIQSSGNRFYSLFYSLTEPPADIRQLKANSLFCEVAGYEPNEAEPALEFPYNPDIYVQDPTLQNYSRAVRDHRLLRAC